MRVKYSRFPWLSYGVIALLVVSAKLYGLISKLRVNWPKTGSEARLTVPGASCCLNDAVVMIPTLTLSEMA